MSTPQYKSYDMPKDIDENQHSTENERLDQLEKEVCCLRCDFEKIKSEQAIMKTTMERAVIRDSSLSDSKLQQQHNGHADKNLIPENCPMASENIPNPVKSQFTSEKLYSSNAAAAAAEKNKRKEKQDGDYFTLG